MLEKLITNIKNSLPGAKKNTESDEENIDEMEEISNESEVENSSEEDEKKKKTSMLIRVVVILVLGYMAVDHFILNPESENEVAIVAPIKKKKLKPLINQTETTSEQPPVEQTPSEQTAVVQPPVEQINEPVIEKKEEPVTTEAPVENINITEKKPEEEVTPKVEESPAVATGENSMDNRLDQLIQNVEQKEKSPAESSNLADKIVEEETETAPPPYDVLGRGLVYNCKEKFWACIDKPNYVTCNKNMKWNKSKGNAQECVVQNVYNSDEDCIKVQKYNVSSNVSTAFCQ